MQEAALELSKDTWRPRREEGVIFTMKLGEDEGSFSTSPRHLEL